MFRSEIRDSLVNGLLEKTERLNYGKFLAKIVLHKVRGFSDQTIKFDFPVTAIIGPNGGGKTTVLGAAGCCYVSIQPRRFFAKSGKFDESMQDWSIEYELVDRTTSPKDTFRRTSSFKNRRWNRESIKRNVVVFGVSRTVPANERTELARYANGSFQVSQERISKFSDDINRSISHILAKDVSGFQEIRISKDGRVTLLIGETAHPDNPDKKIGYSEFHFGAGESSIIRMIASIETAEPNTLVLIEEIENGLHPVATVRLVEYLIDASSRKQLQVIFTTHSNEALLPLPSKAVWVATQNRLFQGKLDVKSLRAITGKTDKRVAIFVEDKFAKHWVEGILRTAQDEDLLDQIEIFAMEGDGTAVTLNKYHNANPAVKTKSCCIIDGDSRQEESLEDAVFRLPGLLPESTVFDQVIEKWNEVGGRLTVALLQPFERQQDVLNICREIRLTNRDPHLLYAQVGEKLGFIPEASVQNAFIAIWAQAYAEEAAPLIKNIKEFLQ